MLLSGGTENICGKRFTRVVPTLRHDVAGAEQIRTIRVALRELRAEFLEER